MNGIVFNGKHSFKDFGLTIKTREIGIPAKNKIKETVPFMQGSYDFSNLYGEQTYAERPLVYTFNLINYSKVQLNIKKTQILDWLLNSYKANFKDDIIPGYYFMAECEDVSFEEGRSSAEIIASFTAYPFKYRTQEEGSLEWDDFNFELDVMQDVAFEVEGTREIEIYNNGSRSISPTVITDSEIDVTKGATTYRFNAGTTRDWRFTLDKGINSLTLEGDGNIEFRFRKEVL